MSETTAVVVPMPHMGVSVEEGTVIEWHVAVGEEVAAEQVLCEIATDKVDSEVPAPVDGVLSRILAEEGATVAVGEPLAELTVAADAAAALERAGGGPAAAAETAAPTDGEGPSEAEAAPAEAEAAPAGAEAAPAEAEAAPAEAEAAPSGAGAARAEAGAVPATEGAPAERAPVAASATEQVAPEVELSARAAAGRDEHGRFDPAAAADAVTGGPRRPLASPLARRIAARHGIDLSSLRGSGRRGRICKEDVESAIAAGKGGTGAEPPSRAPAAPGELPRGYDGVPHEVVATSRVRRAIAEHMSLSRRTAAHMTTEVDVDLSAAVRARSELNERRAAAGERKLSYLPFIARVTCAALAEYPDLNATFQGERMIRWQTVNLGIAVDTPEGLLVPVVRDCQSLTAPAIGDAVVDLAERARDRRLSPDDLAGGTFTISNPGSVGAVSAQAIINQPQVAILGLPAIQRRPWVITDEYGGEAIAIRSILRLAVTFDHRAVDGADATRFAVAIKDRLESWGPEAYT